MGPVGESPRAPRLTIQPAQKMGARQCPPAGPRLCQKEGELYRRAMADDLGL